MADLRYDHHEDRADAADEFQPDEPVDPIAARGRDPRGQQRAQQHECADGVAVHRDTARSILDEPPRPCSVTVPAFSSAATTYAPGVLDKARDAAARRPVAAGAPPPAPMSIVRKLPPSPERTGQVRTRAASTTIAAGRMRSQRSPSAGSAHAPPMARRAAT